MKPWWADTTKFIWDGQDVLLETDENGTTQVTYTQTPAVYGSMVSQRRDSITTFYHHDALGSTLALTNSSETVTDSYRFYAFGETLTSSGSTTNPFRYVGNLGYYNEGDISLQYLRARYYQPSTGRFVSVDLTRNGVNWYVYAHGNPVTEVDPSGLRDLTSDEQRMIDEALRMLGLDASVYLFDVHTLHRGDYINIIGGGWSPTLYIDPAFFGKDPPPSPIYLTLLRAAALLHEMGHKQGLNEQDAYLLHNCWIQSKLPRWPGWAFSEKYKPSNWPKCAPQICANPKYRNWTRYIM